MVTDGIAGLGHVAVPAIVAAVAMFDRLDADNDPYGARDFGSFEAADETIFFKIDYYDRSLRLHSPDPADAKLTARVLTIMLASEY